jgi:hypothetical protein
VSAAIRRIICHWTILVTVCGQPGYQQAGLVGALVSLAAGSGLRGGEQADSVSDDAAVLAGSLRQPEWFGHIYGARRYADVASTGLSRDR